MKIEFDEETFYEDDDVWSTLFVKIGNGDWHMAKPRYNTEDKAEIINIIRVEQLTKFVSLGACIAVIAAMIIIFIDYGN